jgi:ABC-type sugar transport system permease subunit/ABC-type glycerol-3-phosphate transport system substrate-binding protein
MTVVAYPEIFPRSLVFCLTLLLTLPLTASASSKAESTASRPTTIKVTRFFEPNNLNHAYTRHLTRLMAADPSLQIEKWGGISLPGGKSGLMMSIAGNTAPDIGESWFHLIRNEIKQGFLYPLNEWIGHDHNRNGVIDDEEAIWEGWKKIPAVLRNVATIDGKVYGLPQPMRYIMAIIYRIDMVEAAGLDPNAPPQDWNELLFWCQKLTDANKSIPGAITQLGQRGICIPRDGYKFLPWVFSAGGEPVVQKKRSPTTGIVHTFPQHEHAFLTPEGEDLSAIPADWRCNFDSPEAIAALEFLYRLRWGKWVNYQGRPMNLEQAQAAGWQYNPAEVITGVARSISGQRGEGASDLLSRGEVAMIIDMANNLRDIGSGLNLDPQLLSWFPYPAAPGPAGQRNIQTQNHYAVMYTGVAKRPKHERDAIWKTLLAIHDQNIVNSDFESMVLEGLGRFVPPKDLQRLGYDEYIRDIPMALQKNFQAIDSGLIKAYTEPWSGHWFLIDIALNRECLGIMLGANGEKFDFRAALRTVNRNANSGLMYDLPEETLARYRPWAWGIFAVLASAFITILVLIFKSFLQTRTASMQGSSRSVYKGYLPALLILPALLLILLWRYYPLARGLLMAFQDYKVTGDSRMVGLDNFIHLCLDKSFWMSILRTCYFVFLNILLAFTAPIILAIMLTEIKHCRIFFRTLFFLPQMTSGLVIALMWKLMYNPTPAGFFNQLIGYLNYLPGINIPVQSWLEDPALAMVCCIIPTVWASMGMSSLLYLAALQSIPPDLYEAADLDGAGFRAKLLHITLPTLLPLIIISFVGTFIATFQNMGNIFLMTFGGPGQATTVIGLKIWQEAYMNLRFGMATAMACLLGTFLIGMTYIQIRFLSKVEYRRAVN